MVYYAYFEGHLEGYFEGYSEKNTPQPLNSFISTHFAMGWKENVAVLQ
jgi:hypothetical protein